MTVRVAVLSVHTCPLAALGGKETGGMNVYVREVARELGRMGVGVDVFTRSQSPAISPVVPMGPNCRVIHLPAGPEAPLPRERVHAHLHDFVGNLETFRRQESLTYDVIHAHYWLSGVAGLILSRRWGVPLIQMFHTLGHLKNEVARLPEEVEPDLRIVEEERIVAEAHRLVASNAAERAHLAWYYRARADRIRVIPCGVDLELFRPMDQREAKAALGLGPAPLVLYVGRLRPIKGLETLLEAVSLIRAPRGVRSRTHACRMGTPRGYPALFVIGGDADEPQNGHLAYLRERAQALGLRHAVRFLGAQPQEHLRLYYAAAEMTVMPSYYESFGMVALEAMACGNPVIASRVGGLTTTVQDGVTGYLVPEGDPGALAERISTILTDNALRRRLGAAAARRAAQYQWPCVAEAICRLYAEFLPQARGHLGRARCR